MKNKKTLEVFNQEYFLNKAEVLEAIEDSIEHYKTQNEEEYSEEHRKIIIKLFDDFYEVVKKTKLPEIKEDWWYYEYRLESKGISLQLCFCEDIEFDEDGCIGEMSSSGFFDMVTIKSAYLTVEQFAEQCNVKTTTVRQWIRRGKIRNAIKTGRDWLISELTRIPSRGYEDVTYFWDFPLFELEKEYPFLNGYKNIYFFQDDKNKTMYHGILGAPGNENRIKTDFTTQEREKLELALITNENVKSEELSYNIIYIPCKR